MRPLRNGLRSCSIRVPVVGVSVLRTPDCRPIRPCTGRRTSASCRRWRRTRRFRAPTCGPWSRTAPSSTSALLLPVRPEPGDRVEPELHRLVAVDRVRVRVGRRRTWPCRRRGTALPPGYAVRSSVATVHWSSGVDARREPAVLRVRPRAGAHAVAAEDLGGRDRGVDVLGDLHAAVGDDPGEHEAVRALAP